jgi:hypothetical protein
MKAVLNFLCPLRKIPFPTESQPVNEKSSQIYRWLLIVHHTLLHIDTLSSSQNNSSVIVIIMKAFPLLATICLGVLFSVGESVTKRFIFRQDDVEDFYHNTVQKSMVDWFIDHNVGVTIGIIAGYVAGQDTVIMDMLHRCIQQSPDKCGVFNHGWDAVYHYGADPKSVAEAYTHLKQADDQIKVLLPGYQVEMFIPHENDYGAYALQAVKQLGYLGISASTDDYSGMAWDLTKDPMQLPQQATTGDWSDAKNDFVKVPIATTVANCNDAAARGEVCVIMTHPHEFANGQYTLTMLNDLVNTLYAAGFTSTNFHTVIYEKKGIPSPVASPVTAPVASPVKAPTAPSPVVSPVASPVAAPVLAPVLPGAVSTNGQCGIANAGTVCPSSQCCSQYGWCGTTAQYCDVPTSKCQVGYGQCTGVTTPVATPVASPVATPVASPVKAPTAPTPVASPVATPVASPVATPVASPVKAPTAPTPVASPVATPVASPVASPVATPTVGGARPISNDGSCGAAVNKQCKAGVCCSKYGFCGTAASYCAVGCQVGYGTCNTTRRNLRA